MGIINERDLNAKMPEFVFLNDLEERPPLLFMFCNFLLQMGTWGLKQDN